MKTEVLVTQGDLLLPLRPDEINTGKLTES
jgi:hypothetical protein